MAGLFTIVDSHIEGDQETEAYLARSPALVNDWLYELVDETIFFAAERLRVHAPGSIDQLVSVDLPREPGVGAFDGIAGVEPDITEENFLRGLGSDPADWPVFVDVGTGVYGDKHEPIRTIPGHVMAFEHEGRMVFTNVVKGQPAQHYSDQAFEDTTAWLVGRVEIAKRDLGRVDG